jgi:hypothetical protein
LVEQGQADHNQEADRSSDQAGEAVTRFGTIAWWEKRRWHLQLCLDTPDIHTDTFECQYGA